MSNRWIKTYEKIINWEWFKKPLTAHLFLYLLVKANYETRPCKNIVIERGSLITSREKLSQETGLSIQQVRTALEHLKSTNDITIKATSHHTIITICNYGIYQGSIGGNQPANPPKVNHNNRNKENKNIEKESIVDFKDPIDELFNRLWQLYPRKEGKSSVSEKAKKDIYKIGYDRMARAIEKYKRQVAGREMKYVKMGSSFFNTNYVDYLEEDQPIAVEPKVVPKKIYYD